MAAVKQPTGKRGLIDKANQSMVIAIAVAGFIVVFSIVASRALLSQRSYQSRVITEKKTAVKQLDANIQAVEKLAVSYKEFVGTPDNVLGGNPEGSGDKDGNNAKIVLDALPSKYDFPAFVTSIQKLLSINNYALKSVSGTDDEIAQSQNSSNATGPVEIPFTMTTSTSSYQNTRDYLLTLERSIRPIKLKTLELTADEQNIEANIAAVSYYQGSKGLTITKKVVE